MTVISPELLPEAIRAKLSRYTHSLDKSVSAAAKASMDDLVAVTKATAPRPKEGKGTYWRYIDSKSFPGYFGVSRFQWYVKPPYFRLTHLLDGSHRHFSHGQATGVTVHGSRFLQKATKKVFAEFEAKVVDAVQSAGV